MSTARQLEDALDELLLPIGGMGDNDPLEERYQAAADAGELVAALRGDLVPYLESLDPEKQAFLMAALAESLTRGDVNFSRVLGNALIPTFDLDERDFFGLIEQALQQWIGLRRLL